MTEGHALIRNLVRFPRALRRAGAQVPAGVTRDLVHALAMVGLDRRDDVFSALRAVCVRRPEDFPVFEATFRAFFRSHGARTRDHGRGSTDPDESERHGTAAQRGEPMTIADPSLADGAGPEAPVVSAAASSPHETLRHKDFAAFTDREIADAKALLATLRWRPDERRTHRWTPSPRGRLDLQRWLRTSHRHGGDVVVWPRRTRRTMDRPLVLLCDVSGSMERYSRMLIHFAHAMVRRQQRVEVFLFATRLARVTRYAHQRGSDALLRAIPRVAPDWAGGTRIGEALRTFNRRFGQRALRRRPVVLLISDGWDRGDPELLRTHIERLQRSCARLVWLNPLLGTPGYEPLTRGMQAARPFVDDFLPAHSIDSLVSLARTLNQLPPSGRRRSRAAQRLT